MFTHRCYLPLPGSAHAYFQWRLDRVLLLRKDCRTPDNCAYKFEIYCGKKKWHISCLKVKMHITVKGWLRARGPEMPDGRFNCASSVRTIPRCTLSLGPGMMDVPTKHLKQGDPKHALSWASFYLGIQEGTFLLNSWMSDRAFQVSQRDQCKVLTLITLLVNQWIIESSQTSGYEQWSFCVTHALARSPCNASIHLIAVKRLSPISGLLELTFLA